MREVRWSAGSKRFSKNVKDGLSSWEAREEEKKLKKEMKERLKEISTKPQMVLWFIRRWGIWIFISLFFISALIFRFTC